MAKRLKVLARRFCRDESGTTVIEYATIASLVAIATIASLRGLGSQLNTVFTDVTAALTPPPTTP